MRTTPRVLDWATVGPLVVRWFVDLGLTKSMMCRPHHAY